MLLGPVRKELWYFLSVRPRPIPWYATGAISLVTGNACCRNTVSVKVSRLAGEKMPARRGSRKPILL